MIGSTSLKSQKALLTRYCNNIERILNENEKIVKGEPDVFYDHITSKKAQTIALQLHSSAKMVQEALDSFTALCDALTDPISEEQQQQIDDYVAKAHHAIELAQTTAIEIECNRMSVRDHAQTPYSFYAQQPAMKEVAIAQSTLPPIPIPSFSGKIWEFQNFWTLFVANVHNLPLTKLQKFNYLLNALRGEARETVRRYPVTEDNYDHAVRLLCTKYGDDTKFIACLQSRLENAKAEKSTISAQRRLLESLIPIVTQLREKGVPLDGSYLVQKILSKFSVDLQRKVLRLRMNPCLGESAWSMQNTLADLDEIISMEEKINDMINSQPEDATHVKGQKNIRSQPEFMNKGRCNFCSDNHKSVFCQKYTTSEERRAVFRELNKCLNCAKQGHYVKDCPKEGCRLCNGKKHHHTLCPQRLSQWRNEPLKDKVEPELVKSEASITHQNTPKVTRKAPQKKLKPTQAHLLETASCACEAPTLCEEENSPKTVLSTTKKENSPRNADQESRKAGDKVLLLTGVARVRDSNRNAWKDVEVLLDTGADQSFISQGLAEELGLVCNGQKSFKMYTFGTETPRETTCGEAWLDLWDHEGVKHELRLYTIPVLSAKGKATQLGTADLEYITQHKISLSRKDYGHTSRPQILLGCDQLWNFLQVPYSCHTLPSGLQLVPSKLGYLLTGRQMESIQQKGLADSNESDMATFVNFSSNFDEELERWDKYWTMDSAGVCEFTGTKNAEKDAINAKVAKFFEDTIEKREDGYYIRFPYKENHPPLPTNKAIAFKRLKAVIETLRKTPQLLRDYEETFRAQQEIGVIEEIADSSPTEGNIVHYIPHQPVITPHKETTKLRIVFDASAHFKDSPSLNDVLHQGPLILPELYAMLLRFRIPKFVIISDVEKAFLQVRLHEFDRDATRFLWVRDVNAPFGEQNVRTFRFTRVTFGLNVSPYLLGATIHHHLSHAVKNVELANEIRENLYVDNLILSADTPTEATKKSLETRKIFKEMGMNIREFLSNDETLRQHLPETAYAKSSTQKVLGIPWNAETDCFEISCSLPPIDPITKRTVARKIASIYDPLGWLVPLLIPAKKFQQDLWRKRFQWDSKLPPELISQWTEISKNIDGFQKSIPRRFHSDAETQHLAVFADASEIAIAACGYLFNENTSLLMMAKSKLPSIKTKTTMPKLEMNALTLATRLALSIAQALKLRNLKNSTVYIFSDSQIALSWLSSTRQTNLGVLVENRLREIRRIVRQLEGKAISVVFGYVNTYDNPADAGTRGLTKEQIRDHNWWEGPSFLRTPVGQWLTHFYSLTTKDALVVPDFEEEETVIINTACGKNEKVDDLLIWNRCRSFSTAKRITALVLRFIKKLLRNLDEIFKEEVFANIPELKSIQDSSGPLEAREIRAAKTALIRNHQLIYVTKECRKSMENTLRLYEDENRIWRSKGRLGHSALSDEAKNPVFVAPNTGLAEKIINEAHGLYHKGIEHTIATIREHFWIPKLRQQVRKTIKRCVQCRRFNALPYSYPETPDLPQRRVIRCHPFQHTGLDFFDLPSCNENNERIKLYGCIFTCAVTRLIHLEVVRSLNTNDFINALRRFIARRGLPESITCDNAPTFLLSANILGSRCNQINHEIVRSISNKEIQWNNITPYAPWQGGFYERLIKSIKQSIQKALRSTGGRSFDDILTFIAEVEACLNSRPLTYQASAQEEMSSVRPIDFVQKDITLTLTIPELINSEDSDYLPPEEMRAIQYRQQVLEALHNSCKKTELFWKIWQAQYLTSLRETHRRLPLNHRLGCETPQVGDVVLVNDPILPRNEWRMARISNLRRGEDGEVREAELLTATKRKIRRPVNLLIPLEIQESRKTKQSPGIEHLNTTTEVTPEKGEPKYNLRPRQQVRYIQNLKTSAKQRTSQSPRWFLFHLMLLSFFLCGANATGLGYEKIQILTNTTSRDRLQVCAKALGDIRLQKQINKSSRCAGAFVRAISNRQNLSANLHCRFLQKMEQLRRELRATKNELAKVRQELHNKQKELRDLRNALPTIPEPSHLYNNIVNRCNEFFSCTVTIAELDNRLKALRQSGESWEIRLHKLSLLELSVEKSQAEIMFIRYQLRTLFAIPALLIAMGTIKSDIWRAWMERPQYNEQGDALLMRQDDIERVAADQLNQLYHYRESLIDLRTSITDEGEQNTLNFQQHINAAVANLQATLDTALLAMKQSDTQKPIIDVHMDDKRSDTYSGRSVSSEQEQHHREPTPEGIRMEDHERSAIQDNAEFLEEVEGFEEANEVEVDQEPHGDPGERVRRENANMRQQIEREIQQLQQSCANFRQIIEELRKHPTCPPRRFGLGAINNEDERHMRCAFCRAIGRHYSDSCVEIISVFVRRRMIEDRGRCVECLEYCYGGTECPKYYVRCFHCRKYDHHSALCELPDKSEEIAERRAKARRSLAEAMDRIEKLERDLRFFQD